MRGGTSCRNSCRNTLILLLLSWKAHLAHVHGKECDSIDALEAKKSCIVLEKWLCPCVDFFSWVKCRSFSTLQESLTETEKRLDVAMSELKERQATSRE